MSEASNFVPSLFTLLHSFGYLYARLHGFQACLDKPMVRNWKSITQMAQYPVLTQTHNKTCALYIAKHRSCKITCSNGVNMFLRNVGVDDDALSQAL